MGYYLNTKPISLQKSSKGQGDAVVHLSATALSGMQISVPTREEQALIATILSDMDDFATCRKLIDATLTSLKALGVGVYLVSPIGEVGTCPGDSLI